ncbi:VOC family protein [Amycolatopsis mongoliensis]|uniref:VOC family protein n=1 Tax=Amycolatopsis mongoliensis TaxID=715475 RepID=A0A9Y2JPY0_9PSEU|nr:VOC family protein [Amycolatopsis sp. 4-36]WIY00844.1 VOC family protein [Amycolatopsis sp. 4-36]
MPTSRGSVSRSSSPSSKTSHRPWPSNERSQQLHLDLAVEDLDRAEHAAIRSGATKETHQPDPGRFRVLRDPAGHPFCLRG